MLAQDQRIISRGQAVMAMCPGWCRTELGSNSVRTTTCFSLCTQLQESLIEKGSKESFPNQSAPTQMCFDFKEGSGESVLFLDRKHFS